MAGAQWELGVARFGLFLRELQVPQGGPIVRSAHGSLWFGTALVVMGVIVNLLAALQHTRFVHRLRMGSRLRLRSRVSFAGKEQLVGQAS